MEDPEGSPEKDIRDLLMGAVPSWQVRNLKKKEGWMGKSPLPGQRGGSAGPFPCKKLIDAKKAYQRTEAIGKVKREKSRYQ